MSGRPDERGAGELALLMKRARLVTMTPAQLEAQRRSFAFGNLRIENPLVTRELVDRVADEMLLLTASSKSP